jgi:hypothetical protein
MLPAFKGFIIDAICKTGWRWLILGCAFMLRTMGYNPGEASKHIRSEASQSGYRQDHNSADIDLIVCQISAQACY